MSRLGITNRLVLSLTLPLTLTLLVAGCTGAARLRASSPPPPPSCAAGPCATQGAIRWSVSLGVALRMVPAAPVAYRTPSGNEPLMASVGSALVIGWDATVRGLDATTGASRWTAPANALPAGAVVESVHGVGPLVAVSTNPRAGASTATEILLDPTTGKVVLTLTVRESEGAIWSDGQSVVAIEPGALVRIALGSGSHLGSGRQLWSVPLPASQFPRGTPAAPSPAFVSGAVAAGVVAFGTKTAHLVSLADGSAIPVPTAIANLLPASQTGSAIIFGPAAIYDAATRSVRWLGASADYIDTIDTVRNVLYVSHGESSAVRAYSIDTGKPLPPVPSSVPMHFQAPAVDAPSLVVVRDGVAVSQSDDSSSPGSTTTFTGRDVATGGTLWTSAGVRSYFAMPGNEWDDAGAGGQSFASDYVAGLTCDNSTGAQDDQSCPDVHLTLINN
jgi:hypothetical protein